MRIKQIELCGFKSFCDRTVLDFRQAVTSIVGPNGCGKSNVVDALRWAMGEQSAKHLRGKAMEDVIFNGSDSRGPSGMSEIAITFENDGMVPVEYLNYSELTVLRRLHRDGTSEYFINKVPVRLRDVTNLFLGTGAGTKAYSIIEQGRVGLIVSAKPEDRRLFIEEAAGITKYRRRKVTAERKMEATRQNLMRVTDIINEIEKRLGTLRRQAKKAERYKEYKKEMRDIELWQSSHKLLGSIAQQKVLEKHLREFQQKHAALELEINQQELDVEKMRLVATEQERMVSQFQESLYQVDNKIKLNESAIKFQSHESSELQQRAEQARQDVIDLRRQLTETETQLSAMRTQFDTFAERRAVIETRVDEKTVALNHAKVTLQQSLHAIERERTTKNTAENNIIRAESALKAIEQRCHDLDSRRTRTREELNGIVEKLSILETSALNLRGTLTGIRASIEEVTRRRDALKSQLSDKRLRAERGEAELEVLRTELHRRKSRLASLKEIHDRHEGLNRGTREILQRYNGSSREKGILGVVADLVEAPPKFEVALEAVLGQRLGTVVVDSDGVGREAVEYLKQNDKGRTSFIPREPVISPKSSLSAAPVGTVWASGEGATSHSDSSKRDGMYGPMLGLIGYKKEYEKVATNLLSDVVVVENLDHALNQWANLPTSTLVTLDGEILEPRGTITGGSREAENSGLLRQKREIKELTEILADLEAQYEHALEDQISTKAEITQLEQMQEALVKEGHDQEKRLIMSEKDSAQAHDQVNSILARQRDLMQEVDRTEHALAEMQMQKQPLAQQIETASRTVQESERAMATAHEEQQRLQLVVDRANADVTESKVEFAQAEASYRATEDQLTQLKALREDRERRITRLEEDSRAAEQRAEGLRENVARMEEELYGLVSERTAAQQNLTECRVQYEEMLSKLHEREGTLKQGRTGLSDFASQVSRTQIKLNELEMGCRHVEEQIWERYRERLSAIAGDFHLRPAVSEVEIERLKQLRDIIDRMGEINLTAIDEYNELNQRFEFLSGHKNDLEGALGQLQRAIQKINRTCRQRFQETFDLVDAKFQEIFPRLFNGGRAKLILTEAEDVLEGGVEIVAQPPGKKLQSLSMMSGGEKALTAVSMIFAMFLVKPTPFCLLDEVDAPLDDANVARFCEMVRDMSEGSQFILITHNRQTMAIADRLYGVTMEEPGISKVLSVNLKEAERHAA